MKSDMLKFFNIQRQIFGICPHSGQVFRLSDCKVYLKTKPIHDWKDKLDLKAQRLDDLEEKIEEEKEMLKEEARKKGRKLAWQMIRKIDSVFTPRKLNPDDAKVIFHPIDYVVFNGMKEKDSIKDIMLLDRETKSPDHRRLQRSIEKVIERENYEWLTLRVRDDGTIIEK
jgi:predicted Holliday junction resolvase-like endonuclease